MRQKRHLKVVVAFALVLAVAASLWFSAPVGALDIDIDNPTSGTIGTTYSFTVEVSIRDAELLPIESINLDIYNIDNPTLIASYTGLPLETTADYITFSSTSSAGGDIYVKTTAEESWGYGYGYGYASWQG